MKKSLYLLILSIISLSLTAQDMQVYVPFRIGDKFGVSDENGKMIIPANYDEISVGYNNDFTARKDNKASYILNNKIIIKDGDYTYFDNQEDFVIGVLVKNSKDFMYSNGSPDYLSENLYNKSGEPLLGKSYNNIIVIDGRKNEKPALTGTALLLLYSTQNRYSLHLFDKKQKKIIKTFFENSYEVDTNYDKFPQSFSIIYQDLNRSERNLTLNFNNGKIESEKREPIKVVKDYYSDRSLGSPTYSMPPPAMEGIKMPPAGKPSIPENALEKIGYADSFYRYIEPDRSEKLTISYKDATFDYGYLKKENGKIGYFLVRDNKWLVPPKYDEIFSADGHAIYESGFVVRTGDNYQFFVASNKNLEFITSEFKDFPLFFRRDYGRKGFHLFKLYDKDKNFIGYANKDGKIYYKK